MNVWMTIWTTVFVAGIAVFVVTVLVVGVGAIADIRDLFRSINSQHEQQDESTGDG